MVKKLKLNLIRNKFKEEELYVFSPFDLQKYFNVSKNTASLFLTRNVKKNNIIKLRKGLYIFSGEHINEMLIANKVCQPSYISFEYALMFYNIIPETVYPITSATSKITKEFIIENITYSYYRIKKEAFVGYKKEDFNGQSALIAEQEKAFVDYLYFVDLRKKVLYSRIDVSNLSKDKLIKYAKLFKRKSLLNLTNKIYDQARRHKKIIY